MRIIGTQRGFTLIETMVSISIAVLVAGTTASMMIATLRSYQRESAQVNTDTDASIAMRYIISDVREAKDVELVDSTNAIIPTPTANNPDRPEGVKLNIILPTLETSASGSYYDRTTADSDHKIYYYLSDLTGEQNLSGATCTYLWRKDTRQSANKQCMRIAQNVNSLKMIYDQVKSIKVSIITKERISGGTAQNPKYIHTDLTQREVYLRND